MRRIIFLLAAAAVGLTFGACGDDDDDGGGDDAFTEENLADGLVEEGLLEREAADCVASTMFDKLSDEQVKELEGFSLSSEDAPSQEVQDALTAAIGECVEG